METHMALQKLTMTKVMMVSHCSFVKAAMVAPEPVYNWEHTKSILSFSIESCPKI